MEVTYYGGGCVYIATKQLKVLVDPVTGEYGPNPKLKPDVILYTQEPKKEVAAKSDVIIQTPGEYEIKSVMIEGVAARLHIEEASNVFDSTMFLVTHKNLRLLVCGNIHPDLSENQIEQLDGVDVLVVPVGGSGLTLDKEGAASIMRQFDPNFVIPVHYDDGKTEYPMPQSSLEDFLQEIGASDVEPQNSLKVESRESSEVVQAAPLNIQQ